MLKPGDTFERYTIEALLGQGGMGAVYRALDTRLDRRVALKVVVSPDAADTSDAAAPPSTPEATARLLREARAAAALDHPNAVAIYDVGEVAATPYIVMELVPGQTLRAAIGGSTPVRERIGWLADVARALSAAHKKGLVHRDIKPENVMVRDDGVVKVLDFGIARKARAAVDASAPTEASAFGTLTAQGVQVGTPLYMAPEQIRGDALDGRVDQFAWGVMAYELFTGKVPWRSKNDALALVAAILTQDVDRSELDAAGVPDQVASAIMRALSKREADRFASMDDLAREIEPFARGDAPPATSAPRVSGPGVSAAEQPRAASSAPPAQSTPASTTALQRYTTDEMREVLQRALERQNTDDGKFSHEELLAAAREVGVDAETLRAASRDLRAGESDEDALRAYQRRGKQKLVRNLATYAVVIGFLFIFNLVRGHNWWIWPALGWGISIALNAVKVFFPDEDAVRREEEKRRDKDRGKRRVDRSAADERKLDEAASILLGATSARQRIGGQRVRIGETGGGRDARAEAEAAEAEAAIKPRARSSDRR